ncbi:hypothetical protein [Streptomyces sp. CBMA123]|uniref:hypothetical protein n=1 Tax=Streptomyces sp. CBMA123 TaxID=1896313 RepID=UPI001661D01D|nr:hypothetical protein [Streptomyces sp. CBMA123]MBD0693494.1 hypothetical protein [Streptomyces sp. CBMA123]
MALATSSALTAKSLTAKAGWLRASYDWRSSAYAVAALPVGLVAVPLALLGGSRVAYRLQRGLAVRLLDARIAEPARGRPARVVSHGVLALPLQLLVGLLTAALWADFLARGVCYPLAVWGRDVSQAWGGPTLVGAWAAHFAVGVLTLAILLPVFRVLVVAQRRLAVRLLGTTAGV